MLSVLYRFLTDIPKGNSLTEGVGPRDTPPPPPPPPPQGRFHWSSEQSGARSDALVCVVSLSASLLHCVHNCEWTFLNKNPKACSLDLLLNPKDFV